MEKWGGKSQSLKKFVRNFWNQEYGLGDCVKDSLNKAKHVTLAKSKYFSATFAKGTAQEESASAVRFVCSDVDASGKGNEDSELLWRKASPYEKDYSLWTCNENGSSDHEGNAYDKGGLMISPYSLDTMVCEKAENGDSTYRKAFAREISFGNACTYYMDESDTLTKTVYSKNYDYVCVGGAWRLSAKGTNPGRLIDERDNQVYATITIGAQEWMAENLNYTNSKHWGFCYSADCLVYGKSYIWSSAMDSAAVFSEIGKECGGGKTCSAASASSEALVRGICPAGWHLPSLKEWETLLTEVGETSAGAKLKYTHNWNEDGNGTDEYGFSMLPLEGAFFYMTAGATYIGKYARFWTATEYNNLNAYHVRFKYDESIGSTGPYDKGSLIPIRCLKDPS